MIRNVVIYKDGSRAFDVELKELKNDNVDWYWVDFCQPSAQEHIILKTMFNFHPGSVLDCINEVQKPKMDYYYGYRFIVLQATKDDMSIEEIDIFLSDNFVVTFCQQDNNELQAAWDKIREIDIKAVRPDYVLFLVCDEIIDHFFPLVQRVEDKIQDIDELGSESDQSMIDGIKEQLSELSRLRRIVKPMKDLLYRILNSSHVRIHEEAKVKLHGLYEHLIKILEDISDNREMANDIRESYISTNSHKMNRTMKTLTSVSIIFLPLTFIAGIYGMNFDSMPELHAHYGYPTFWIVTILLVLGMWFGFKKKDLF
jgi:magnesium transporter